MTPRPTDDELDALLARARRETSDDAPAGLRELIRFAMFEPRQEPAATSFLALLTLSFGVLILATVITPALAATVAILWWVPPILGVGWIALKNR
jgi:hypothetical protein